MKKSVLFRTALIILVLTMVSSCFVGGTFAKYVTSGEGTDSARVAKFGVEITANGSTFAETYATDDATFTKANSVISYGVLSEDVDNVIAPGTSGNMVSMTLKGIPEVAVEVSYAAEVELDGWLDKDGKYYCPLEFTIGEEVVFGSSAPDAETLEQAIEDKIAAYTAQYEAHTDLSVVNTVKTPVVSWSWPFSTSDVNDEKDTYLGDQAADNAATVKLTVECTVTQID